ncbi:MAG: DUF2480 family protein [Flavobacteriales bacterium]|jgi:hypothetical protein|nr:DUF2480 family protein [Flavobacteriales bacterium]
MSEKIINKVASSQLITLELKSFKSKEEIIAFDIKNWLFKEQILKEKEFRLNIKKHDWSIFTNKNVAIICSVDSIIPNWAYMLISIALKPYAKFSYVGSTKQLEEYLFNSNIQALETSNFTNKKVLIKGCSESHIPTSAYVSITNKLLPVVQSLMFGEACSNVPLFKKPK